jgi:hypothetical protein
MEVTNYRGETMQQQLLKWVFGVALVGCSGADKAQSSSQTSPESDYTVRSVEGPWAFDILGEGETRVGPSSTEVVLEGTDVSNYRELVLYFAGNECDGAAAGWDLWARVSFRSSDTQPFAYDKMAPHEIRSGIRFQVDGTQVSVVLGRGAANNNKTCDVHYSLVGVREQL